MASDDFDKNELNQAQYRREQMPNEERPKGSGGAAWLLAAALVVALAGIGYLLLRSSQLNDQITALREDTQTRLAQADSAAVAQHADFKDRIAALNTSLETTSDTAGTAVKNARMESRRKADELAKKLNESQEELSQLKDSTSSKLTEVASDVDTVKGDVNNVKGDVTGVKTEVATAQSELEQHGTELKRVRGDMGVMSGLIATNNKDLAALRELGERNYFEFTLSKNQNSTKIGDVTITLKKADTKRNRYTVDVLADDKHVEKRDRTINEPVQIYVSGSRQPDEIVVNQVGKDQVVGYLSTPKVVARR